MERNELSNATVAAAMANQLVGQAQRTSSSVQPVAGLFVPQMYECIILLVLPRIYLLHHLAQ
jgi:hypothetical protein